MFQSLSEKFQSTFRKLSGRGVLSENNIKEAVREIRMGLLAADIHVDVVRKFVDHVTEKAKGVEVLKSVTPYQQFIKVVHDELVEVMGGTSTELDLSFKPPVVILCVGLQGAGKTTTIAKLALELSKRKGRRPFLIPADTKRPAAVEQLHVLARQINIEAYPTKAGDRPVDVVRRGVEQASTRGYDVVLIDTAGRLHVDEELMEELQEMKRDVSPHHILLVVDSMTGQDAVQSTKRFHEALSLSGVVMTKLDGDARGGAALSVRQVTGCPIVYMGTGEKISDIEPFYPDRMASRILGMGDVVSLVEHVQDTIDVAEAEKFAKKVAKNQFTLDDFFSQLKMMKKMGSMDKLLGMIPGIGQAVKNMDTAHAEKEFKRKEAILSSMTLKERRSPKILNGSRRKRIALGSGTDVSDVNRLMKEFETIAKMMGRMRTRGGLKNLMQLFRQ